ncbi:MAG: universal stress protein [Actinomycetota bacterium]
MTSHGSPQGIITGECESGDYDLVVVGSRGHGPARRAVLGSVSDLVARLAANAFIGRIPSATEIRH